MLRLILPILLIACGTKDDNDNSQDTGMDEFNDIIGGLDGGDGDGGESGGSDGGATSGDGGSGSGGSGSGSDDTSWNSQWHDALAGYRFTYYYNASDYSEKIVYTFCQDGSGSYFWSFLSGGITGSASDTGEEHGTWEVVESNQMAVNIKIVGQTSGEGYIQMEANSSGQFFIDGGRYYREGASC